MSSVWDSHIHLFTKEMSSDPVNWAKKRNETIWKACVAPPDRPSIQAWASPKELLENMDEARVEKAVLLGWYWEHHETCKLHNRFYSELINQHSDRLLAFATIQPSCEKDCLSELNWARQNGFLGIGEIHPQAQGFSLKDDSWLTVMDHIVGWNFPVNFHVTDPDSKPHPGRIDTPLEDYVSLAKDWPDQTIILSHLGGLLPMRPNFYEQAISLKRLYYDCAAIPLLYSKDTLREFAKLVDRDHILFGSDYPLRVIPKHQKKPDFSPSIQFVRESGLTEEQLNYVLSENAKRLFTV